MTQIAVFDLHIKPEALAEAPELLSAALKNTRARVGCLGVDVATDASDPTHFMIIERWESVEANEAYQAWRKTPEGASPMRSLVVSPPTITRLELRQDI